MKSKIFTNLFDVKSGTFSSDMLKLLAALTMLIDHIGAGILSPLLLHMELDPNTEILMSGTYSLLRLIGRISFPIYTFLLVQSFSYTSNKVKFALNLLIFGILSELPFDLLINGKIDSSHQNVFWTLFIGLLAIWAIDVTLKAKLAIPLKLFLSMIISAAGLFFAYMLKTDYQWMGILMILSLYFLRDYRKIQCFVTSILFFLALLIHYRFYFNSFGETLLFNLETEWPIFFAFLLIRKCNGRRLIRKGKYLFYAFYPVHFAVLWGVLKILQHYFSL